MTGAVGSRLPGLLIWLLLVALALSLAWWTWRLLPLAGDAGPVPTRPRPAAPDPATQGWLAGGAGPAAAAPASSRYILRWLHPGPQGLCILGMPDMRDKALRVGEEVVPGLQLHAVNRDHVILKGAAGLERIELTKVSPPAGTAVPPQPGPLAGMGREEVLAVQPGAPGVSRRKVPAPGQPGHGSQPGGSLPGAS